MDQGVFKNSRGGHFYRFRFHLGILLISPLLLDGGVQGYMVGSNPYRRVERVDPEGKYIMEWEVDRSASRITFNLTVETTGYVGFGLRAKGPQSDADIVIGGVWPGGEVYFSDQHATPGKVPEMDTSQDYELHEAWENGTHTFLSFSRALDTCDPEDHAIVEDKVSMVWAYSERDELTYHYKSRGEYLVHLLNPDYTPVIDRDPKTNFPLVVHSPHNEDVKVWSWHMPYLMPTSETTYWCSLKKGPVLSRKHHMIGFEVRFNNPVSQSHLHHVIISRCRAPPGFTDESLFGQYVDQGQLCYGAGGRSNSVQQEITGPIRTEYCMDYLHMTAAGDRINFLPPHVGTPFGEDPLEYYLIQMHYDNPQEISGVMVDVNLDIFYTPQLREHEGDLFVARHETPGLTPSHLVPPFSIDQKSYATCGSECTRKILPAEGIYITAILLHAHNSGVGMRLRHFRDGKELAPVAVEDNFSFRYQQMRVLPKEAHILPGDQLVTECTLDNIWANGTVVGGFSTRQEMCASWFFYYNRMPNHMICASEINSPEFRESFLGIQNMTWSTPDLEYVVTAPRRLAGLPVTKVSNMLDWTMDQREEFNEFLLTYPHSNRCPIEAYSRPHTRNENGEPVDSDPDENLPVLTPLPPQTGFYEPPKTCSERKNQNSVVQNNNSNMRRANNNGNPRFGNAKDSNRKNGRSSLSGRSNESSRGWGKPNRWN